MRITHPHNGKIFPYNSGADEDIPYTVLLLRIFHWRFSILIRNYAASVKFKNERADSDFTISSSLIELNEGGDQC